MSHTVDIERVAIGGEGVAHLPNGKVAFVRGGYPGDAVDIEFDIEKKRFAKARATKIVTAGKGRTTPACAYVDAVGNGCGGCHFQAAHYVHSWDWKAAAALEAFCRAARIDPAGIEVLRCSSPAPDGYRRRLRVHIDAHGAVGFFRNGSHEIAGPARDCRVAHPTLRRAAEVLGLRGPGTALLELDASEDFAVVLAQVPPQTPGPLRAPITGLAIHSEGRAPVVFGETSFDVDVRGLRRTLPAGVFTQANAVMNEALVVQALSALGAQEGAQVLELYCGAGNFTLDIARQGAHVVALDVGPDAIEAGQAAARRHELADRISFGVANLRRGLPELQGRFDAVLLDPPRTGAKGVMDDIAALAAPTVVYVSCDPPTAGRDAGTLAKAGYTVARLALVDMFPRTSHVELVAQLVKLEESDAE